MDQVELHRGAASSSREDTISANAIHELREFHRFLSERLSTGPLNWSPEEAVDEWRRLHPEAQDSVEDQAAIQQALEALANGDRGVPFTEFDRDFRAQHNIAGQA